MSVSGAVSGTSEKREERSGARSGRSGNGNGAVSGSPKNWWSVERHFSPLPLRSHALIHASTSRMLSRVRHHSDTKTRKLKRCSARCGHENELIGVHFANNGRCIDTKVLPRLLARVAFVVQRNWQVKFPNLKQPKNSQQDSSIGITICGPPEVCKKAVVCFYHRFLWRTCESNLTFRQAYLPMHRLL
jgi:hypothetical protein